jgi:NADH-quinone oxidoreductase subunit G/NADP-reducing hydrogenase subunit HndD
VGAITEQAQYWEVIETIRKHEFKRYVAIVSPDVHVAISEAFHLPAGTVSKGKVVAALRALGFTDVFDGASGNDVHAVEGAQELVDWLNKPGAKGPLISSVDHAFVKYVEQSRSDLIPQLSKLRSPAAITASIVKHAGLPQAHKIAPTDVYQVSFGNLTSEKDEIERHTKFGFKETDRALTTRELAEMIKIAGINFTSLEESDFDHLPGTADSAGAIYGAPGGIAEMTLRAAYRILNQKPMPSPVISGLRGMKPQKVVEVDLGGKKVKVAAIQGMADGIKFLDKLKKKDKALEGIAYVELIATPGGAVNGGGSPRPENKGDMEKRVAGMAKMDKESKMKDPFGDGFVDLVKRIVGGTGFKKEDLLYRSYAHRPGF